MEDLDVEDLKKIKKSLLISSVVALLLLQLVNDSTGSIKFLGFDIPIKAANLYHYSAEHDNSEIKLGRSRGTLVRMYELDGKDRLFAGVGSNFVIGATIVNEDAVAEVFYDQTTDKMQMRVKAKSGVI